MRCLPAHVVVHDLNQGVRFYTAMFGAEPTMRNDDYAKWELADPRISFAIARPSWRRSSPHTA